LRTFDYLNFSLDVFRVLERSFRPADATMKLLLEGWRGEGGYSEEKVKAVEILAFW
jgi:hypothetical protein